MGHKNAEGMCISTSFLKSADHSLQTLNNDGSPHWIKHLFAFVCTQ